MKLSTTKAVRQSPLGSMMRLKNGESSSVTASKRADLAHALPLTSLIDAFSIIVIYLLIGTQGGGADSKVPARMALPIADSGSPVEAAPVVRVEGGVYFIDDKPISAADLGGKLFEIKKRIGDGAQIIVQADKAMSYAALDPLLRAGLEAGLQKLKFAVMPSK